MSLKMSNESLDLYDNCPDTREGHRRWFVWMSLGMILLFALALRLYRLDDFNLWEDEIGQAIVAQQPWGELLTGVRSHHGAAPLDYVLTAIIIRLSQAAEVLRLPAVVWGVLSVYWLFRIGRRFGGIGVGLLAAWFLATSPLHVRYSQELRFYSLPLLLMLMMTDVLISARTSRRKAWWVLYATLAILGIYTYYYTWLLMLFHGVWLLVEWLTIRKQAGARQARSALHEFVLATVFVGVTFLPWVWYSILQEKGSFRGPPDLTWLLVRLVAVGFSAQSERWWALWVLIAILGIAAYWRKHADVIFLLVWLLGAFGLAIAIDYLTHYFFALRQILYALPAYLLLIAAGAVLLARILRVS